MRPVWEGWSLVEPILAAKAAAALLTDEKARKGVGWAIVIILSPIIVVLALLCVLGSGTVSHNISAAQLCFQDGPIPSDIPAEYRACIEEMREHFAGLDQSIAAIEANMEDGGSLDPIRAALGGTVKTATYNSSYGNYVTVDHGNGLVTLYAHNSRLLVRPGQVVQTGDVVSLSGATGRVTGPHLHFEVRVNGQRTNPRYYLP